MEFEGLNCSGCGSSNVEFDPNRRMLICNQCGKKEFYSRATLNANGKVMHSKDNAFSFFMNGSFEKAQHYALEIMDISKDNAAALYIMAYYDEFIQRRDGAMKNFFTEVRSIALEYDEVRDLIKLFIATGVNLSDYEFEILTLMASNMQSDDDIKDLSELIDKICPLFIKKRASINFMTAEHMEIYTELAEHCDIPKTCFALLKSMDENPDSPYSNNGFYLKARTKYYYDNYVLPIGKIINGMKMSEYKDKFVKSYTTKKIQFEKDAAI